MPGSPLIVEEISGTGLSSWDTLTFLRKVTEIVPSVIYIFNQHTQSNEYANRSVGEALGYSTEEIQHMGANLLPALCHPDDLQKIATQFQRIAQFSDGEIGHVEYRMRHKNGSWVWLQSADTVFDRDDKGRVRRHIGVASVVTNLKRAEELARTEARRAQSTTEELRNFAYSVTHDLKSPSNTLNLVLHELLESHAADLNEDAVSLIGMALKTVARMGTQIEEVLDYTRVVGQEFDPTETDLDAVLREVLGEMAERIAQSGARIALSTLPRVLADREQMMILFHQLIANALSFHKPDSPPAIRIAAETRDSSGTCVITVQDDGVGIHPSKHEYVFQIFKRLNIPANRGGGGLGLPICRRIAINHGSAITLTSAPNEGATFSIELPLISSG